MSYTPTEWDTGDIVTAEKLNKLENGVAAAAAEFVMLNFGFDGDEVTLPSGFADAYKAAKDAGKYIVLVENSSYIFLPATQSAAEDTYTNFMLSSSTLIAVELHITLAAGVPTGATISTTTK